jgi:hypothetical protein
MKHILFNLLPDEIILYISKYLDSITYRNGKYICKLLKNDIRYELFNTIKPPLKLPSSPNIFSYTIWLNYKNGLGSVLYYYYNFDTKHTNLEIKKYVIGNFRGTWRPMIIEHDNNKYYIDENSKFI